jgi:serine/threonine protein kinase/WD40 repeat protein
MTPHEERRPASLEAREEEAGSLVDDPRVTAAVEEYLAVLEAGRRPDRDEFLARHADIASTLAGFLQGLDLLYPVPPDDRIAPGLPVQPGVPLGDFCLRGEIGRGGMGVVYEAIQLSLGRRVALKVLPLASTLDPRQLQRFKNEAQAAACLHHPHIVPIYAVGVERGVHYYAMQLIEGRNLAALIAEERRRTGLGSRAENGDGGREPAPPSAPPGHGAQSTECGLPGLSTRPSGRDRDYYRAVARLGIQAALALEHAHQFGVIHRDIKPANLLVDAAGELWVTDFGLAQMQAQDGLTMTGDLVGTLRYMSPEQVLGQRRVADSRTDVYSLGVTLYELLTLHRAFPGGDRQEVLQQIAFAEPRPPRRLRSSIPVDLETIILKAAAKNPDERYQTAQELADDLRAFCADQPIRARRPSLLQRGGRWTRRHRPVVVSLALSAALLLVGFALGILNYAGRQAELAKDRQNLAQQRTETLYRTLLSRASALRLAREPGYRRLVWDDLHRAASLREGGQHDRDAIRAEVLACLGDPIGLGPLPSPATVARRLPPPVPTGFANAVKTAHRKNWPYAVSSDGNLLGLVSTGVLHLWNAASDRPVRFEQANLGAFLDVAFSPDGRLMLGGCDEGLAVWNVPAMRLRTFFRGGSVTSVAVHPSGRWAATAGRRLEVWSLISNRLVLSVRSPIYGARVEFSADGDHLLAVLADKVVEARPFRLTPEKRYLDGHDGGVPSVAFGPDGRLLASVSKDQTLRIWDVRSGKLLRTCRGHRAAIEGLAFSPDGKLLASGDSAGVVLLWDPESGREVAKAPEYPVGKGRVPGQLWRLQFSPCGEYLYAAGNGGATGWLLRPKGKVAPKSVFILLGSSIIDFAVHPGGKHMVVMGRSGELYRGGSALRQVRIARRLGVRARIHLRSLHFDRTGRRLLFVSAAGTLGIWDWEKKAAEPPTDQSAVHLALSPDGRWAATPGPEQGLVVYDLERRRQVLALPPEGSDVWSLAWSPDGTRVAVGLSDGGLALWDLRAVGGRLAEFGIAVPRFGTGRTR